MGNQYPSRAQYRSEKMKQEDPFKKQGFHRIVKAFFICVILLVGLLSFTTVAYLKGAPSLNPERLVAAQSSAIYDMNDEKIVDIAGEEYRKTISLEEVPEKVQNAFLAVEDNRFWSHNGIDVKRVAGAVVENVKEGFGAEGASTITQQLVKLTFLTPEKTMKRKIQEAYLALKLERRYTKEEILEMYLNKVYFGERAYGVATAAEVYFSKSVNDLTISEAALLAGLPQRPSSYNPFKHPELAEKRRNTVLSLMEQHGYISKAEKEEAQSIPVTEMLQKQEIVMKYRSFIDHVLNELQEKGFEEDAIFTQGLKVYTTLDPKAQEITEKVVTTNDYIHYPDEKFKAGVALIDTKTGEIRALGGSRSAGEEEISRGFNYATQLKRQPGSTIKPIMAYGPAIEKLDWSPNQVIRDEQIEINGKVFRNWNNRYHGNVTMKTALQWSYNIPAIKTMQTVGTEEAKEFAGKLGIELDEVYPAYAIGGFKNGISPLQLAGAFAAFGNEGMFNKPYAIRKVVHSDGREQHFSSKPVKAMSKKTAYLITDMLKSVVRQGTGTLANIPGLPLAGKTGTNQLPDEIVGSGAADAWFVGYTTLYTASVWTGYDKTTQDTYIKSKDTQIARLIFKQIMSNVSEGKQTPDFIRPPFIQPIFDRSNTKPKPRPETNEETRDTDEKQETEKKDEKQNDNKEKEQNEKKEPQNDEQQPNPPKPEEPKDEEPPTEPPEPVEPVTKPDEEGDN